MPLELKPFIVNHGLPNNFLDFVLMSPSVCWKSSHSIQFKSPKVWLLSIRTNRDLNWLTLLRSCLLLNKHCSKLQAFPDQFVLGGNHSFNPFSFSPNVETCDNLYSLKMRISTFSFVQMWRHATTYSWRREVMTTHQFTNSLFCPLDGLNFFIRY